MALEGSLSDFGIAEILQLIGSQQKTGILHVGDGEGDAVQVLFSSGRIIGCEKQNRARSSLLGTMLLDAEVVTKEQLNRALKVQKQSLKRVGDALVEINALTRAQLAEFAELQTRETLYKLFEWKAGRYRFESKPPNFAKPSGSPLSTESVLMEGFRMMDEWPLIRARINNFATVYKRIKEVGGLETEAQSLNRILDDAFSEVVDAPPSAVGGAVQDPNLGRSERRILARIDGKRDVYKLISLSRLGEFETCKALLNLVSNGYIAPSKVKKALQAPNQRDRKQANWLVTLALNLLVLGAIVGGIMLMPTTRFELHENAAQLAIQARSRLRANRISVIGSALEVHRIETGAYPDELGELVDSGLVLESTLSMGEDQPLRYVSIGTDYDLR